ncbi:hypothetical protein QFC19_002976 [Naganishia cerealis]|uniref:Uncharacterized protein n=1 Tax=Naganishia cerealis TaxID=610337 RepID=A0ACC2W631_9TREE|nr:hypothetical protein QFC19_002976 [Naganishia cerealis]
MRRGSLELVQKILQYQPKVVCFVGKKIWDEFEFVIKKSARPAKNAWTDLTFSSESGKSCSSRLWKCVIKRTDARRRNRDLTEQPPPTPELAVESNSTNAHPKERPKSSRPPFQWDQPRPYRVVHSPVQGGCGNTLFWVVPSTSGLVRVQVSDSQFVLQEQHPDNRKQLPEQIEHFAALGRMIEAIQHDQIPYDIFKEIDPDGVAATVALIPE